MKRLTTLFCTLFFASAMGWAAEPFAIRGVLPWHNFLCGPTAWNEEDYEKYLDSCQAEGINFIGFHNYTGGGERYASYVEPMIRISYKGIVPRAMLDNSLGCRWGALPMPVSEFAFGSQKALDLPKRAEAFGSNCSVLSKSDEEHYRRTQQLMQRVLKMAHERGIRMAMGFEFGVVPPEYFSLYTAGECFFWLGAGNMIPNPCHPTSIELHRAALDNLLDTYPEIDYIWLWLNEHSFLGVVFEQALGDPSFAKLFLENAQYFEEATSDGERFVGVWALQYIRQTIDYLRSRGSDARLIIGGWGGGGQLPGILRGLDRALPEDVVFSCLNPDLGRSRQPEFLAEIARHRDVWAVPWLEGDNQMWHQQPRVSKMQEHVRLAREQRLQGVVAIHWRTAETRYNFKTFARYARLSDNATVEELYREYFDRDFGTTAAAKLAPLMARIDASGLWEGPQSPEYFAFKPDWGHLDAENRNTRQELIDSIETVHGQGQTPEQYQNLEHFKAMIRGELLLDQVVRAMMPGWELRDQALRDSRRPAAAACVTALDSLHSAPVEALIRTYVSRTESRGEMGILSSINQRLWNNYLILEQYLTDYSKQTSEP